MASVTQVRAYLAYWFQLGKPVVFHGSQVECLPCPIFQGDRFSPAFEQCWRKIMENASDCYLRGTDQTIATLLTDEWEVTGCARCTMPMPMPVKGVNTAPCPCNDLPLWPNDEIPVPRLGVDNADHLENIRDRLIDSKTPRDRLQQTYLHSPNFPKHRVGPITPLRTQDATRETGS